MGTLGGTPTDSVRDGLCRDLAGARRDFALKTVTESILLKFKVVAGLQIQPQSLRRTEVSCKPQRCVRGDRALAMYDLVDATSGNADVLGQAVLRKSQRDQEIFSKNLTRWTGGSFSGTATSY